MTYTHDEIMAMDADALRLAIAGEKGIVYDFSPHDRHHFVTDYEASEHNGYICTRCGHSYCSCCFPSTQNHSLPCIQQVDCPDWSGDIAAAWELVEEMGATHPVEVGTGIPYFCKVYDEQYVFTEVYMGQGDTAPLAICRAWLMWKAGR